MKNSFNTMLASLLILSPMISQADGWSDFRDDIKRIVKDTGKVAGEVAKAPLKVVEKTMEATGEVVGGDVGKELKRAAKEVDRMNGDVADAFRGSGEAVAEVLENPVEGFARVGACVVTLCVSEVRAQKKLREIKRGSIAAKNKQLKAAKKQAKKDIKVSRENRINELEEIIKGIEDLNSFLDDLGMKVSSLSSSFDSERQTVSKEFTDLAKSEASRYLITSYFENLDAFADSYENETLEAELGMAEMQLLELATINNISVVRLLNLIIRGYEDGVAEKEHLKNLVMSVTDKTFELITSNMVDYELFSAEVKDLKESVVKK